MNLDEEKTVSYRVDGEICLPCQFRPLCTYFGLLLYYYGIAPDLFSNITLISFYLNWVIDSYEFFYFDILECE
jgi:hypothetical protein